MPQNNTAGAKSVTGNSALADRMQFLALEEKSRADIRAIRPLIDKMLPAILDEFYRKIGSVPEVARFFTDTGRTRQAKGAQLRHWSHIGAADFDADYLESARAIGQTHARIGLDPRWYIGGYALISAGLIEAVLAAMWPKGLLSGRRTHEQAADTIAALIKAVMLDMDLAISTYIDAAEAARRAAEESTVLAAQQQAAVVEALTQNLARLASGDLTCCLPEFPRAYQQLRDDFNGAVGKLNEAIGSISLVAHEVIGAAREISEATTAFSERTEEQAASLEETSSSMEEIAATVKNNAENAKRANTLTQGTRDIADRGGGVVSEAVSAMARIEESSRRIADIISVIDEIARQTNLLALNAAVEAARAGEAGRGFAVVAAEVRSLAQRSSQAAKDIKSLILNSSGQVQEGVQLVNRAGVTLQEIVTSIKEVAGIVSDIATASGEQAVGIEQVNGTLANIDEATQQNAAMGQQNAAAARTLDQQAESMVERIGAFRLSEQFQMQTLPRAEMRNAPARPVAGKKKPAPLVTPQRRQGAAWAVVKTEDWKEF